MRVTHIQWQPYRVPFRRPQVTAHGTVTARVGAIVAVTADSGLVGHGEAAALPEFNGWVLPDLIAALAEVADALRNHDPRETPAEAPVFRAAPPQVRFAVSAALWDLRAQAQGVALARFLAPQPRAAIPVNTVISDPSLSGAVAQAGVAVASNFPCVKLKVGMLDDSAAEIVRISAVRAALGPDIALRLDANEAWTLAQAQAVVRGCQDMAIDYIEQPLRRDDLAEMRKLRQTCGIPIAADEAITDAASVARVIAAEAADVVILKPQMVGSFTEIQQAVHSARGHGLPVVITSALEGGIGVAAAAHLAASLPLEGAAACGLATLEWLEDDMICEEMPIIDGMVSVPQGPGLGVTLDEAALARYAL